MWYRKLFLIPIVLIIVIVGFCLYSYKMPNKTIESFRQLSNSQKAKLMKKKTNYVSLLDFIKYKKVVDTKFDKLEEFMEYVQDIDNRVLKIEEEMNEEFE